MKINIGASNSAPDTDLDVRCNGTTDSATIQKYIKNGANIELYAGAYNLEAELLIGSYKTNEIMKDVKINMHPGAILKQKPQVASATTTYTNGQASSIEVFDASNFKRGMRIGLKNGTLTEANLIISSVSGNVINFNMDNGGPTREYPIGTQVLSWNNAVNIHQAKDVTIKGGLLDGNREAGGYITGKVDGMDWGQCGIINAGKEADYNVENLKIEDVVSQNWFYHAFHTVGPVRDLKFQDCRALDCLSGDGFNLDSHGYRPENGFAGVTLRDCKAMKTVSGFRMADCNNVRIFGGETCFNSYYGIRMTNNYPGVTGLNPLIKGVYCHNNPIGVYMKDIQGGLVTQNIIKEKIPFNNYNCTTLIEKNIGVDL